MAQIKLMDGTGQPLRIRLMDGTGQPISGDEPNAAIRAAQAEKFATPAERRGAPLGTAATAEDVQERRPFLESATGFVKSFIGGINPLPALKALYDAGPVEMIKGMTQAQFEQFNKAKAAYDEGRYSEALGYTVAGAAPLIGPAAAAAGERIGEGNIAEGAGEAASLLVPSALVAKRSLSVPGVVRSKLNPAEKAAVAVADAEGIGLDLATRTGGKLSRNVEALVQNQPGGAGYAQAAKRSQAEALAATAQRKLEAVEPRLSGAVTPENAGVAVKAALESKIKRYDAKADVAYSELRQIEADPNNIRSVQIGKKTAPETQYDAQGQSYVADVTTPVMADIALPVDMRPVKAALAPVYERIKARMPVARQQASPGFKTLENILSGDDHVPASVADGNLSTLKAITREATSPELRNVSQGLAAKAISELSAAVDAAVAQGGQAATAALQRGRRLTKAKYTAADVLADLKDEPVQVFNQLTQRKDTAINALKTVAAQTPENIPKLAKAYLEGMFEKATREGDWGKTDSLFTQWKELGPQTKRVLFGNPNLVRELDGFFLISKRLAQNPNPSGTAYVASLIPTAGLVITAPQIGVPVIIGNAALSRIMFSPKTAKLLTDGMRMRTIVPAAAITSAELIKIAGDDLQYADKSTLTAETLMNPRPGRAANVYGRR